MVLITVPKVQNAGSSRSWLGMIACAALMGGGCDRESAQLTELRAENDRLKTALLQAQRSAAGMHDGSDTPVADLDLTVAELWAQRFEDNQFRSKQRLDHKEIRVTGMVESVLERSVSIFATGTRFGSVSMIAQLDDAYIAQVKDGLGMLQKGAWITVQGRFVYEKMGLQNAAIIDRQTGWRLTSKDLADYARPTAVSVRGKARDPLVGGEKPKPDQ